MSFIVQHEKSKCIGCAACAAVAPNYWNMDSPDGKSNLINAKKAGEMEQIEIQKVDENKDAAEACPVNAIHIIKKESGEKII
jgi:ferredoxin